MSNNSVINSVGKATQNPISIPRESESFQILPRYSVNDYVKHVYTKGKFGVVINVDPTRFSYFSSSLPAYLIGWESGEESWVSGGSIRGCSGKFNVKDTV